MSQVASHQAESAAVSHRNAGALKAHQRAQQEYNVKAQLDNVQYLNDIQEEDVMQDRTYQAMMDQWSSDDLQLKNIFAKNDFEIEDAIVAMHEGGYAGTQTGKTAGRLAAKSAKEAGYRKSRAIHNKMMAQRETTMRKGQAFKEASDKSRDLFMDVAFAPVHGARPAAPHLEQQPSKTSLFLGLAKSGLTGYTDFKANRPTKVSKSTT